MRYANQSGPTSIIFLIDVNETFIKGVAQKIHLSSVRKTFNYMQLCYIIIFKSISESQHKKFRTFICAYLIHATCSGDSPIALRSERFTTGDADIVRPWFTFFDRLGFGDQDRETFAALETSARKLFARAGGILAATVTATVTGSEFSSAFVIGLVTAICNAAVEMEGHAATAKHPPGSGADGVAASASCRSSVFEVAVAVGD